jgi:glutamate synthase domain-containing protein 2/glutamate synthase domain-containing protein 1/glutamate synthase domain-containing protein 3
MGAQERSACGVGFVASREGLAKHAYLEQALRALVCVEHRGGCLADGKTGDGAGIMTEVPFELLGYPRGQVAVAQLFMMLNAEGRRQALSLFEATFNFMGLELLGLRDVPIDTSVLGRQARETMPTIVQAFVKWPEFCRTEASFNALLYHAKQAYRTHLRRAGLVRGVFFTSLSTSTIIYKALVRAEALAGFYPDLRDPRFVTRFALFHRRFSTNTSTSWDKAQPFRLIAHNGEINTIECNRAWSYAREQALGLPKDELLTHQDISDSGSLNEMVEALRYRSSIPHLSEILAIMVPPAQSDHLGFYKFWSRALEPWDGPAFLAYSDGEVVGARLDRNGFRPCRWAMTQDAFYLSSEAGTFGLAEGEILQKGLIHGGSGTQVILKTGEVRFEDPAEAPENAGADFDARVELVGRAEVQVSATPEELSLFRVSREEIDEILLPMIASGKEPIGSMGDTARLAVFSDQPRSFFDFFYQGFAQVTNPPLDHLRERIVTELTTHLGARPNVFAPKTLIPLCPAIELSSPILDPEQLAFVKRAGELAQHGRSLEAVELPMTFPRVRGAAGLEEGLQELTRRASEAIQGGCTILVLSDRSAKRERPPIPSLLALRAVVDVLEREGLRLEASLVIETGDARTTHQVAALVGYGAAAVCPYLVFGLAEGRWASLRAAYEAGLLKVMSKVGISSVLGYQGSRLFTPVGLGPGLLGRYFRGQESAFGGLELLDLAERILAETDDLSRPLGSTHQLREHGKGLGEKHSVTSALTRRIHNLVEAPPLSRWDEYQAFVEAARAGHPISPRHLLELVPAEKPLSPEDVQPKEEIWRRFGAGSISFGAVNAEAQRDVILAMRQIGGRSGSGEGGENPFYDSHGITATSKQVASARFGVTAEFLVSGEEIEIKVAQGAKPGEGGQLMAVKVDADIARARHSLPGVDLISPPPLHDVYSIEDLRQLIYELKQLKPGVTVSVKLVSGAGIGAIATGVVKAGADVVHVSGGDGGTGAATLSSMKHAGLPWELGLYEVHRALTEQQLREHVVVRVDGGLLTGQDVVMAALFGAEEMAFGKLLLVAEGCIMARVCEKNTCPRGIATHDPKFKAKYRGRADQIVTLMHYLAEDVRRHLAQLGFSRLEEIVGRADLMRVAERHQDLAERLHLDLSRLLERRPHDRGYRRPHLSEGISRLNQRLLEAAEPAFSGEPVKVEIPVSSTDRAVLATLAGEIAQRRHRAHLERLSPRAEVVEAKVAPIQFDLIGSAGQGFGVFCVDGLQVTLHGEANDSVAKSMSGGRVVVRSRPEARFTPEENAIIGNCALYGATGGTLYVRGLAGDRFAVRNSGATAVVEGAGLHACEYMTKGTVVILGAVSHNAGAGMTGGVVYLPRRSLRGINAEYVRPAELELVDQENLREILIDYRGATDSATAGRILEHWSTAVAEYVKLVPLALERRQKLPLSEVANG